MQSNIKSKNVNDYIKSFPKEIHPLLEKMRSAIKSVVPKAVEIISYNMPAYKMNNVLVYFAAYKNHIGLYPTSSGVSVFTKYLKAYKTSIGAIQFPIDKPLPVQLIKKIVKFRMLEDKERAIAKEKLKQKKIINQKNNSIIKILNS